MAVVALGGNLPGGYSSCEALLEAALAAFPATGLKVAKRSGWWRSAAWPDPSAPAYMNAVVLVEPTPPPDEMLAALLSVELAFGRVRSDPNAPRTLDLDLIAHGRTLSDAALILPHPRAHDRLFVMGPLAEIAPEWRHPLTGVTARQLAEAATVGRDAVPWAVFGG